MLITFQSRYVLNPIKIKYFQLCQFHTTPNAHVDKQASRQASYQILNNAVEWGATPLLNLICSTQCFLQIIYRYFETGIVIDYLHKLGVGAKGGRCPH